MLSDLFSKFLYINLLVFLIFSNTEASNVEIKNEVIESRNMPFRLGFEFQEDHHIVVFEDKSMLLPLQKKELFSLQHNETKLWHFVIDGQDIEFVLNHFSLNEKEHLELALKSVGEVCQFIKPKYTEDDLLKALNLEILKKFIKNKDFELKVA